ncbi:MAG: DUF4150 domain-containing protein [Planctomycetes bacterium]|nr:DUF4150 domain-containing protein [Planctomycetota bacterium]
MSPSGKALFLDPDGDPVWPEVSHSPVTTVSGGTVLAFPDVCKTPSPGGPIPVPYPNVARSADLADGSTTVTIDGAPVCLKGSKLATSTGDEPGSVGGVVSGTVKGKATPVTWSSNVFIEGQAVVLNGDLFVSNNKNTVPTPIVQGQVGKVQEAAPVASVDIPEYLHPIPQSGRDPGAEPGAPVRLQEHAVEVPPGWPSIPPVKTMTFSDPPVPVELPPGTPIYRVVGLHPKYGTNDYRGECWSLEPLPPTEEEWRRDYAVLSSWNGDGGFIRHILDKPLKAWRGKTGPQDIPERGYILRGGNEQIWIPSNTVDPLANGKGKRQVTQRTPWNKSETT